MMNGFSYPSNRWIFAYDLLVSFIVSIMLPDIIAIDEKQLTILAIISSIYLTLCVIMRNTRNEFNLISQAILLLIIVLLVAFNFDKIEEFQIKKKIKAKSKATITLSPNVFLKPAILALIIFNICLTGMYKFSPFEGDDLIVFKDSGTSYSELTDTSATAVSAVKDKSFYRFDEDIFGSPSYIFNSAMLNNQNGTSYYFSTSNENIYQYKNELNLIYDLDFKYCGVDNRSIPDILSSVEYFVIKDGFENKYLPYGFSKKVYSYETKSGEILDVYKSDYILPIAYTYSSYISRENWENYPPQRQEVLMQAAVLDDDDNTIPVADPSITVKSLDYILDCADGITYDEGKITVDDISAKITLSFDGLENSETYLCINDLWFTEKNPLTRYSEEEWALLSLYDQKKLTYQNLYWSGPTSSLVYASSAGIGKKQGILPESHLHYSNKHDLMINMGYSEKAKNSIIFRLNQIGEYTFDNIEVICQPMADILEQVEALKEDVLENVSISNNLITGNIDLDQSKILCLSIPFNGGWKAYANGKLVELLRVNTMYSGIILEPGHYDIELKYFTPGLKIGLLCSALGVMIFVGIIFFFKVIKNRKSTQTQRVKNK
jgi:uncharacterized membrane protein YfhO